jgi:hypothetical protein
MPWTSLQLLYTVTDVHSRCHEFLSLILLDFAAVHTVCSTAQVIYRRLPGNLQGEVLVIAVNRVVNYDEQPSVLSAAACEEQCSMVSGCQGWTYCSAPGGCGGGCKAYHDKYGPGEPCHPPAV